MSLPQHIAVNLYSSNRILYVLEQARILSQGRQLHPAELHHLDLLHYSGMGAVEAFIHQLHKPSWPQRMRILDVGSGLGGPARFIIEKFDFAIVTGVEYQKELAEASAILNKLCRLEQIRIICDDFTSVRVVDSIPQQDLLISQLCFLHIADKDRLFAQCRRALKTDGFLFVEDFFLLQPLDEDEVDLLRKDVGVPENTLLTQTGYIKTLADAKIKMHAWADETKEWSEFVWKRCESFLEKAASLSLSPGHSDLYSQTAHFYTQIARLFHSHIKSSDYPLTSRLVGQEWLTRPQHLGGVRFIGIAC